MPRRPLAAALSLCLLAAGCDNPLKSRVSDHGVDIPLDRLRRIDPMQIDQFARPAPPPQAPPPDPAAAARERFAKMDSVPLTIEQARASALEHNLDLRVALINPSIGQAQVDKEEARFEAAFTTTALWQNTDEPTSSALVSGQDDLRTIEPGVRIPLRTGGTALISLPLSRDDNNNAPTTLNPSYTSDLAFSISQPLLRNAGRDAATTPIQIAGYNRQITEAQTKLEIINQISAVERTYWRVYQARRNLEVRQEDYELAQAQLERARRVVAAGQSAEIEVIRSEAGVADRLGAILIAQNNVLALQRELKRVVNIPGLDIDNHTLVVTTTEPRPVEYAVDRTAVANSAVQNRMEMLELELQLLSDAANIRFDKNQLLPQLDFTANYRIDGLGNSARQSFDTLNRNHFDDWSLGATLEIPLGNEAAKSQLRASVLTRLQRLVSRDARKLLIRQDVLEAADRIESGWQNILATRQATILSTRSLHAEQRQFDLGASTSTDVLNATNALSQARLAEVQAVVDYQLAQIDLASASGTLLGAAHIRWNPSDPERETPAHPITIESTPPAPPPAETPTLPPA